MTLSLSGNLAGQVEPQRSPAAPAWRAFARRAALAVRSLSAVLALGLGLGACLPASAVTAASFATLEPSLAPPRANVPRAAGSRSAAQANTKAGPRRTPATLPTGSPHTVEPARNARFLWDANLRFRAAAGQHLHDLQAGQDDRVQGVFQRLRLGARLATPQLEARLQLQVSGAFGARGPSQQPLPLGLQAGSLRWKLPAVPGLSAEVGRMALEYGSGRHIARYDFHDEGNAYDGARVRYSVKRWLELDALGVKLRRNSAQPDQERTLFGLYLVGQPYKPLTTDVYLLVLNDGSAAERANLQTMGLRLQWLQGRLFRVELETSVQVGSQQPIGAKASLDHLATAVAAEAEFNGELGLPFGVGLRGQQYSGDDGTEADSSRAWRPLYPDLVRHVGLLQLFAQSGLRQTGGWVRLGRPRGLRLLVDWRYNASVAGGRVPGFSRPKLGVPGAGWMAIGQEVDLTLYWPALPGSQLLVAAGVFTPSASLAAKLGDRVARQLLVQWTSSF